MRNPDEQILEAPITVLATTRPNHVAAPFPWRVGVGYVAPSTRQRYRATAATPADVRWLTKRADFRRDGAEFFQYFVELGRLQPEHRVLEIGCAIGRKALPLSRYLTANGSYDGFDIVAVGIDWCRQHITSRYSNFRFQQADVFNSLYNERGHIRASEYKFPFPDAAFDFAFATSVFTHMLPDELKNYVGEMARVLAPGSRCLASMLLLNEESERCIDPGKGALTLRHPVGVCRTELAAVPEAAVGYPETIVRELFASKGLAVIEPIRYGSWCGREQGLSFQDLVTAERL